MTRTPEESFDGLILEADWADMHGGGHHDDNCEVCRDIANVRTALEAAAVSQPEVRSREAIAQTLLDRFVSRGEVRLGGPTFPRGIKMADLPSSYADDFYMDADAVLAAIPALAQEASSRDVLARKIWDADGPRYTGWPSDGYRVNFAHREQYPSEWNRCLHIADAILEIKDGTYVG